jgi:hypothetical protein
MKSRTVKFAISLMIILAISCGQEKNSSDMNIIFLHHSTGRIIWDGGNHPSKITKFAGRISTRLERMLHTSAQLRQLFKEYNKENKTNHSIREEIFPKAAPYGWDNYPFDYYNIWVKNAGEEPFKEEPTLEMLTKDYQVIIFKHCFPASNILDDLDSPDINSDIKTLSNYKLQYSALRDKLHEFPDTKFILFTGAAQVKSLISEDEALRAKEFFGWVTDQWDLPGDNIYIWDLYSLQTEGGLYFKDVYAVSPQDSHPNDEFAGRVVKHLFSKIIDIIENNGNGTLLNGEEK